MQKLMTNRDLSGQTNMSNATNTYSFGIAINLGILKLEYAFTRSSASSDDKNSKQTGGNANNSELNNASSNKVTLNNSRISSFTATTYTNVVKFCKNTKYWIKNNPETIEVIRLGLDLLIIYQTFRN